MEFEYTSSIIIDEYDMNRICNDVKGGRDFGDAFDDALCGYDDCDYYHIDDIYDDVKKEIERRIRESEKEETKMPTVTVAELTNEELIALRKEVNKILEERRNERIADVMDNFRKAFYELKELCMDIYVLDCIGNEVSIEEFGNFHFEY